ncbi:MAG: hypothetical protein ACJAS1_000571 [Oleiphilaceae bacterium]|jgi:hypothetical protein
MNIWRSGMDRIFNLIDNSKSFNQLITLEGMLAGYFTSPLIASEGLFGYVDDVKSITDHNAVKSAISARKRYLNDSRKVTSLGHYFIGGIKVEKVSVWF